MGTKTFYVIADSRVAASFQAIAGHLREILKVFDTSTRALTQYEELSRLSAHQLADLGLTRADVLAIVFNTLTHDDESNSPQGSL